jgi:hypothetical protein
MTSRSDRSRDARAWEQPHARFLVHEKPKAQGMPISFKPYVRNDALDGWKVPREAHQNFDDFDIRLVNANAYELLATLRLRPHPGILSINGFANLVTAALRRHLGRRSPAIPRSQDRKSCDIIVINHGRAEGYIEARLGDLAGLVQRSRTINATHIGWR